MAASESDVESHEADVTVSRSWQESNSISPVAVLTRNSFGFPLGGTRLPYEQRSMYGCVSFGCDGIPFMKLSQRDKAAGLDKHLHQTYLCYLCRYKFHTRCDAGWQESEVDDERKFLPADLPRHCSSCHDVVTRLVDKGLIPQMGKTCCMLLAYYLYCCRCKRSPCDSDCPWVCACAKSSGKAARSKASSTSPPLRKLQATVQA